MKGLSSSQKKIYEYLKDRVQYGLPPSVREICKATGLKSTSTVHLHLKTLEDLGYIRREAGLNRAIHIEGAEQVSRVPILGRVTAGVPILAVEEVEGYLPLVGHRYPEKELFALRVQGDSMKNAGILDGDYIIAHRQDAAENGQIVVALIDDEATVKRIFFEQEYIRLQPENPAFSPIFSQSALVLGRVISVYRYY